MMPEGTEWKIMRRIKQARRTHAATSPKLRNILRSENRTNSDIFQGVM